METFQPKFILCPTDFSEPAILALHYGKQIADCFGARLIGLYANPFMPPPHFTANQVEELVKTIEHSKRAAREYLIQHVKGILGMTSYLRRLLLKIKLFRQYSLLLRRNA